MSRPKLLDDLQLEENDTIDEVESSDDSDLEVVEACVNDEEPEEPPTVMEVLLDVDKGSSENVAGDNNNGVEAPTEQKTPEERIQAIVEKCANHSP